MSAAQELDFVKVISDGAINRMSSPFDEIAIVDHGIGMEGLRRFEKAMHWELNTVAQLLSTTKKTLERHAKQHKRLNKTISENALEVAKLSTTGIEYFGSVERWKAWLNTPNVQFNHQAPKSVLHTARGRELIRRVIRGLEYGFVA
ncbi:type II RES/Xre toxin-antitoxin system antitoxin [Lacimicrobium alkaliphilum]|uniref:Antitoxin Xre/MbcA/ParS-like toxin-binding domain-containing protein n=1 Tax=Lacimicrobium alkaliphilum TaxID=1526571 RepID=A0ABQ1RK85_9ALTE|nr:antitoxin Xre/MbcA/ParS toxin-binding domain-containing protein [Lacimicrobium alkaliphilum]GGD71042.1 hypothetical protein GCM10011357_27660 [Lacimicrobium alkaliphilum]